MTATNNRQGGASKRVGIVITCAVLAAGIAFGGYFVSQQLGADKISPERSRTAAEKYLRKKSGQSDFHASLDAFKKDKRPWETITSKYDSVSDYEAVYKLMGEHLALAEDYLKSSDAKEQRIGVRIVMALTEIAHDVAVDDWLACRLSEGFLLPRAIHPNVATLSDEDEQMMRYTMHRYAEAEETDHQIELCKMYLAKSNSAKSNNIRYFLARLLESKGRHDEAQDYMKQASAKK